MATLRLEALCSKAEHCVFEIRQKLARWGIAPQQAEKIIDGLVRGRFVDDERFARAYCNDKFLFGRQGRVKIRQSLAAKHVSAEIIRQALEEIDPVKYCESLVYLLRKKMLSLEDPRSFEGRAKLFRFAVGRGFEPPVVIDGIKRLLSED